MRSFYLAKVDQMQENLIAYFRLFAGLPGATFVEEDVTWFVNDRAEPGNHVLRTCLSGDSGASIDRRIDELFRQFGQHADQIDWLVFPACRPADLGKRLEARGMQAGPGGAWMLADLTAPLPAAPKTPAHFHRQHVTDLAMLEAWKQVSAAGFGGDTQIYYDAYARHGFGAITQAMLHEARQRGYDYAWIWSSPIGKSVYSKLGFVAADFGVREYRWRKR